MFVSAAFGWQFDLTLGTARHGCSTKSKGKKGPQGPLGRLRAKTADTPTPVYSSKVKADQANGAGPRCRNVNSQPPQILLASEPTLQA